MQTRRDHWKDVWSRKQPTEVSWFQPDPADSLAMIEAAASDPTSLIDVGGGASRLIDGLIDRGWRDLAVLDIAAEALARSRDRLGAAADGLTWVEADITTWQPPRQWAIWHDRAVFHFLTEANDRAGYLRALKAGLAPGGTLILFTFAPDGPEKCSGLPVRRYDADGLAAELGAGFELVDQRRVAHVTPGGGTQLFTAARFRRVA